MTKKEFKYVLEGTTYITENGKINYDDILNMIMLANYLHAKDCENHHMTAIANAVRRENDYISDRYQSI